MGRAKDYLMDVENIELILLNLSNMLDSPELESLFKNHLDKLEKYQLFTQLLLEEKGKATINMYYSFVSFVYEYIEPIQLMVDSLINTKTSLLTSGPHSPLRSLVRRFDHAIHEYDSLILKNSNDNIKGVNSVEYLNKRIAELQENEANLQEALKLTEGKSQQEINKAKLEAEEANKKILQYKSELEIKQKQEDAKENWKKNINLTFDDLKGYLNPIRNEQLRLIVLFWVYLILAVLLVVAVIVIEWIAIEKVATLKDFPDFKQYITLYLPLPVVGAMLWGFIYQMNRAQRQLFVLAKNIHNVEYIQGLLLSINKLAPSVEDSISRINISLDKLINNHLGQKEIETEQDIIKEENKDSVPIDFILKLAKEIKDVRK